MIVRKRLYLLHMEKLPADHSIKKRVIAVTEDGEPRDEIVLEGEHVDLHRYTLDFTGEQGEVSVTDFDSDGSERKTDTLRFKVHEPVSVLASDRISLTYHGYTPVEAKIAGVLPEKTIKRVIEGAFSEDAQEG